MYSQPICLRIAFLVVYQWRRYNVSDFSIVTHGKANKSNSVAEAVRVEEKSAKDLAGYAFC